jgi:hypothetical protein
MGIDMDAPFSEFAEKHLKQCKHGVPTQNICDTCELGPMPMKKPTLEQVAWIFNQINENAGGSFRKLIYDRLGFGPTAYSELYAAGGQNITNAMFVDRCTWAYEHNYESKQDVIDSQLEQIEVLRPIYEAAKDFKGAWDCLGNQKNLDLMQENLFRAVTVAARELEDSDG